MYTVYILFSESHNKHYTGYTSNLAQRLISHNHLSTKGWTTRYKPWKLIHSEAYADKDDAVKREKWLKTGVGREFNQTLTH